MMIRLAGCLLAIILSAGNVMGQQNGDANRNYRINGIGSGQSSVVQTTVPACDACPGFLSEYATQDAGAPILWVTSTQAQIGWTTTPSNSVDIGPSDLTFLLDGTNAANPLASLFATNGQGEFSFEIDLPESLQGTSRNFAMAHVAVTSPDGFWVSQTHDVSFGVNNLNADLYSSIPSGVSTVAVGNDGYAFVPLGMSFNFFGANHSYVYINGNGNLTFGAPSTSWTESLGGFTSGPPRIAPLWDDLNPASSGVVAYQTTSITFGGTTFKVWYEDVPQNNEFAPNRFSVSLRRSGAVIIGGSPTFNIAFDYEEIPGKDGLVGISPGAVAFGSNPFPVDLSVGGNSGFPQRPAIYELFDPLNPIDLAGHRVNFSLDSNGVPLSQN